MGGASRLRRWLWPEWRQRKRVLRIELTGLVVVAYVAIAAAHIPLSVTIDRVDAWLWCDYIAFFVRVFEFHLGLAVLAAAIVALLCRWWKLAVAAVPLLVFTLGPAAWSYVPRDVVAKRVDVTLLSCNLMFVNTHGAEVAEHVAQLNPDVICLQELTPKLEVAFRDRLGHQYPYIETLPQMDAFGVGVFSKLPFAGKPGLAIPDRDGVPEQRVQLIVRDTTVTLYNMHLYPPGTILDYRDLNWQVDQLRQAIGRETGPLVISGDFNFPQTTRQAKLVESAGLHEAFTSGGWGRGATWPAIWPLKIVPGLRLDHVYLSPDIRCDSMQVHPAEGSDHRMVVAKLTVQIPK